MNNQLCDSAQNDIENVQEIMLKANKKRFKSVEGCILIACKGTLTILISYI